MTTDHDLQDIPPLRIEAAYSGDKLIGYTLATSGTEGTNRCLVWVDQAAMPGIRLGDRFVPGFGEQIEYRPVPLEAPAQPAVPQADNQHARIAATDCARCSGVAASAGSEPVALIEHTLGGSIQYRPLADAAYRLPMGVEFQLYTRPSPPEGAGAEQALRKVLSVVQRYLPPDGPTAHDAMTEITEIVDPWPLGPLEKL